MKQFIANMIWAAKTADSRDNVTIYDIIGAFCVCTIVLALLIIGMTIDYNMNF